MSGVPGTPMPDSLDIPDVDAVAFKAGMRALAATVCVITTRARGEANGMTATAVCSVSVEPPLLLVVVNRANRSHRLIRDGGVFAVNILAATQSRLATHFASRPEQPFTGIGAIDGVTGCPLIEGCEAVLECILASETDAGSHTIFLGRVVSTRGGATRPLLYHDGGFRSIL